MKNFDLCFEIPFSTVIRGHHIYKTIWTAVVGQELIAKPNERKDALDYKKVSIGLFKPKEEENKMNSSDNLAIRPCPYRNIKFTVLLFESRQI